MPELGDHLPRVDLDILCDTETHSKSDPTGNQ